MELTSQYTFTIQEPHTVVEESAELLLLPENNGAGLAPVRELRYPNDALPPLQYPDDPDVTENFMDRPLTNPPLAKAQMTISDTQLARWPGYLKDRPVREIWKGSDKLSRMTAYFLRRFIEYAFNPPASGHITWAPKDVSDKVYEIEIISLTVGGLNAIALNNTALFHGEVPGEIVLTFHLLGEV
jgi:hypothetical protein